MLRVMVYMSVTLYDTANTGCPTRCLTRHFFNNFTANENIATKFEADLPHCVRNMTTTNVLLFKFRCNIFIGVRIIKEMPGLGASGTSCICLYMLFDRKSQNAGKSVYTFAITWHVLVNVDTR